MDDKTDSKARLFTSRKSYLNTASNIRKLERAKARGVKSKEVFTHPERYNILNPKGTAADSKITVRWMVATRFFLNSPSTTFMPPATQI